MVQAKIHIFILPLYKSLLTIDVSTGCEILDLTLPMTPGLLIKVPEADLVWFTEDTLHS